MIIIWYRDSLPSWPVCWVPTLSLWTLKVVPLHIWDNPSALILLTSSLHIEKIVFWLYVWAVSGLQQLQFGCLTWRNPGQSPQCVQINCLHCEKFFCTCRAGPRDQECAELAVNVLAISPMNGEWMCLGENTGVLNTWQLSKKASFLSASIVWRWNYSFFLLLFFCPLNSVSPLALPLFSSASTSESCHRQRTSPFLAPFYAISFLEMIWELEWENVTLFFQSHHAVALALYLLSCVAICMFSRISYTVRDCNALSISVFPDPALWLGARGKVAKGH